MSDSSAPAGAPSTAWSDPVPDGEAARFDGLAARLRAVQVERAAKRPKGRALHYKAHAGLLARFDVAADIPAWARVGIFAGPGSFPAYVRFSNGAGANQPDDTGDLRGIAVKLVGVPGAKLIPGMEDAVTWDLLAITATSAPFRSPEEFVELAVAAAGSPLLLLPRLIGGIGLGRTFALLAALPGFLGGKPKSVAELRYSSGLAIRWGDYAVKFELVPRPSAAVASPTGRNRLADEVAARVATEGLTFDLRVQGWVDEAKTPLHDATVAWSDQDAPWVTVGALHIPAQDVASERGQRVAAFVEALSFDPWHAPADHRPLGALMRARAAAYRDSVIERGSRPEPDGSEAW